MDFDYKKYSLGKLEEWMHDAMSGDASPQEIYDCIRKVVSEDYYYHKHYTSRAYELLALLTDNDKGHLSCDKEDPSPECQGAWNDFWSDIDDDVKQSLEEKGYEWTPEPPKDKVVKWQLPVEVHPSGEYYVQFPDDLLEATNLKEGDPIEWVDQGNGSYILRKA